MGTAQRYYRSLVAWAPTAEFTLEADMQLSLGLILVGAILVIVGVLFTAAKALGRGRLSEARSPRSGTANDTLEPRGSSARLHLAAHWPGLAIIAAGALLLLAGAAV